MKQTRIAIFLAGNIFWILLFLLGYSVVEGFSSVAILSILAGILCTIVCIYYLYKVMKKQALNGASDKSLAAAGEQVIEISDEEIKKEYKVIKKIGIAMVAAVFVYAVTVEIIKKYHAPFHGFHQPFSGYNILRIGLLIYAIVEFLILKKLRGSSYRPVRPGSTVLGRYRAKAISLFSGCLSMCVLGLILFILAGNSLDFYFFFILSLIYFWIFFPRYAQMENWTRMQMEGLNK